MHGRVTTWLLLACSLCGAWGCRTPAPAAGTGDPFLARAASPTPPSAPGTSIGEVIPASYQESPPAGGPLPGVSLKDYRRDQGTKKAKGFEVIEPENIKRGYMKLIGKGPNETVARNAYEEGNQLFAAKQYAEASKKYKVAYQRWPDSPLEEDAMFMAAESCFFSDQYYRASDTYADLGKKYENSRYLDRIVGRQFAIGRYWEEEADHDHSHLPNFIDKKLPYIDYRGNAVAVYESIRLSDPTGPLADDALFATANAHFVRGRYEDADYHYELLRKEYPRSQHQLQAHLLGLRAKLRNYQGAEYDEAPLRDSEKLIESTLTQFVADNPEERERLLRTQKAIRAQKAEREWNNGEYYYRRKYYRASRYYYSSVLKNYPESSFAEMAQRRLDETKNYRPVPKNYFTWVGRIFGERKRTE